MATADVTIRIENTEVFRRILRAVGELLEEIESADSVLVTDGILAAADRLKSELSFDE